MKTNYILPLSHPQSDLETTGGKGASLSRLVEAGLPVPDGFHLTTAAYRHFVETNTLQPAILAALDGVDYAQPATLEAASRRITALFKEASIPDDIATDLLQAYAALPGLDPAVAVRSSATAEDLPEASFAGQQDTYLNVSGSAAVLEAARKCWASLWTARAIGYRMRQGIDPDGVALAVVVQTLVPAEAAGIMFTANPVDGARNQAVISASWGLGEAVVGGLVTPDTLTVIKATGEVVARETAVKQVMTARVNGGTEEQSVPESLQKIPVLSDLQAAELTRLGTRIEDLYSMPMDIEWTLSDGEFAIVQARPITALPEPPLEWVLPDPKGTYMRASIVDLMPDPLSPLFITLAIPTFKKQMQLVGRRVIGSDPVLADDYFTSLNTYAYMNHRIPAKALWWTLTGLLPAYPRLLGPVVTNWREEYHPEYKDFVAGFDGKIIAEMTNQALWSDAQDIVAATMFYLGTIMFATMGAAAGSEGLLTRVYEKLAKREGDPPAQALLMGWDNIPVRAEKIRYDLAMWSRENPDLTSYLLDTPSTDLVERINDDKIPPGVDEDLWREFSARFMDHLREFGHIIFQLDFAQDLPLDHPEPLLETVKMYLRGEGSDPHQRQRQAEALRVETSENTLQRLKGVKRWAFSKALKWGLTMSEVREDALSEIGLGYPKLREILIELGKRFSDQGIIREPVVIFWLEKSEIDELVAGRQVENLAMKINQRKAFSKRAKAETPPPMIPVKERILGIKTDAFVAHTGESQSGNTLKGVPTSIGQATAPARVLLDPADFGQMRPGDVLVASTTTPAWTPLFSMASAVVTDIGGPLSHGSIVAREFGIPAVMGTGIATKRIPSGQMLHVDGDKGTVTILE